MTISLRRWTPLLSLLPAFLLASCTLPVSAPPRREAQPAPAAAAESKLAPDKAVFELEKEGLKLLWPQELGQLTDNRRLRDIYCAGKFVVVEAGGGEVHCLDSSTGVWKATALLRDKLDRSPTARGTELLFVVDNQVFTYDTASDKLSTGLKPGFAVSVPPLVYDGSLVLAGADGHLVTVLPGGEQQFLTSLDGPIFEPPVIIANRIYATARGDKLIALDLAEQQELWRWGPAEPSRLSAGVAIYGEMAYTGDDRGFIYQLSTDYGARKSRTLLKAPVVGKPRGIGDLVLVRTDAPALVCIDPAEGTRVLWRYEGPVEVLAAGEETVYVRHADGSLAGVELTTGKEQWREPLPRDVRVTGDPDRPVLYLADPEGSIVALAELGYYPAE
jgi:hypothetical protein